MVLYFLYYIYPGLASSVIYWECLIHNLIQSLTGSLILATLIFTFTTIFWIWTCTILAQTDLTLHLVQGQTDINVSPADSIIFLAICVVFKAFLYIFLEMLRLIYNCLTVCHRNEPLNENKPAVDCGAPTISEVDIPHSVYLHYLTWNSEAIKYLYSFLYLNNI